MQPTNPLNCPGPTAPQSGQAQNYNRPSAPLGGARLCWLGGFLVDTFNKFKRRSARTLTRSYEVKSNLNQFLRGIVTQRNLSACPDHSTRLLCEKLHTHFVARYIYRKKFSSLLYSLSVKRFIVTLFKCSTDGLVNTLFGTSLVSQPTCCFFQVRWGPCLTEDQTQLIVKVGNLWQ